MKIDNEWLKQKILSDPDLDCEVRPIIPCANREYDKSHPDQVGKPRSLYCGCPRCSPFSC